jgi:hypothetical protein
MIACFHPMSSLLDIAFGPAAETQKEAPPLRISRVNQDMTNELME